MDEHVKRPREKEPVSGPSQSQDRTYREDPDLPGFWFYGDYRIQAHLETHRFAVEWATEHLPFGSRVLDVASGEGALAQQLIDRGFSVSCTSWDGKCRADAPRYEIDLDQPFGVEDIGRRPFPLVCCIEIIEHLENPARFLRNCHSLVEPDGRLILTTPNVESAAARLQWLARGVPNIFSEEEVINNRHISMMWRPQLELLIELAGFEIVARPEIQISRSTGTNPIRTAAKRLVYNVIRAFAKGDLTGKTRAYILRPRSTVPRKLGAGEVY